MALQYASERLRGDHGIVMDAVWKNGLALEFSSIRDDLEIIAAAVKQNGVALKFVGNNAKDYHVTKTAVKNKGLALEYATPAQRDNVVLLQEAM